MSLITYMTDVQTKDGQLVSIQRQEELEQRGESGSDVNVRARGWIVRLWIDTFSVSV